MREKLAEKAKQVWYSTDNDSECWDAIADQQIAIIVEGLKAMEMPEIPARTGYPKIYRKVQKAILKAWIKELEAKDG